MKKPFKAGLRAAKADTRPNLLESYVRRSGDLGSKDGLLHFG